MKPAIAIMAAPRPTPNVHSTLAAMLLASPDASGTSILVSYDGPLRSTDARTLRSYEHVEVIAPDAIEFSTLEASSRAYRARMNYARLLRAHERRQVDLVVLEDDLAFAVGWFAELREVAKEFPSRVLLGYERHKLQEIGAIKTLRSGNQMFPKLIEHEASHSTLCVYWPAHMIGLVAAELEESSDPADVTIDRYLRTVGMQPITLIPSVVDHRGDMSLINPHDGIRRAPQFRGVQ